jgi:hypothetical protein
MAHGRASAIITATAAIAAAAAIMATECGARDVLAVSTSHKPKSKSTHTKLIK